MKWRFKLKPCSELKTQRNGNGISADVSATKVQPIARKENNAYHSHYRQATLDLELSLECLSFGLEDQLWSHWRQRWCWCYPLMAACPFHSSRLTNLPLWNSVRPSHFWNCLRENGRFVGIRRDDRNPNYQTSSHRQRSPLRSEHQKQMFSTNIKQFCEGRHSLEDYESEPEQRNGRNASLRIIVDELDINKNTIRIIMKEERG